MRRISFGIMTVGVFVVIFGVAAYAVYRYYDHPPVAEIPTVESPAKPETATVVVPLINPPKYTRVQDQDVALAETEQMSSVNEDRRDMVNSSDLLPPTPPSQPVGEPQLTPEVHLPPEPQLTRERQLAPEPVGVDKKAEIWRAGQMQEITFRHDRVHSQLARERQLTPEPVGVGKKAEIWRGGQMQEIIFRNNPGHQPVDAAGAKRKQESTPAAPVDSPQQSPTLAPSLDEEGESSAAIPIEPGRPMLSALRANHDQPTLAGPTGFAAQHGRQALYVRVEAEQVAPKAGDAGK